VASGIFGLEVIARAIKPLGVFASIKIPGAFPMRANYFTVELWYRGKLQFVRELEDLRHLVDFIKLVDLELGGFPYDGDGEVYIKHCGVSTYKELLAGYRYHHK
jgi:hypothetical protein